MIFRRFSLRQTCRFAGFFLAAVISLAAFPGAGAVTIDFAPSTYVEDFSLSTYMEMEAFDDRAMADLVVPDDYPTIQAAIDAAQAGDRVVVKNGVYTEVAVNITDKRNLQVVAQGGGQVVLAGDGTFPVLKIDNVQGLLVRGIDLKDGTHGVEIAGDNENLTFDDVNMSDLSGNGFTLLAAVDYKLTIKNSVIEAATGKDGFSGTTVTGATGQVVVSAVGWSGGRNAVRLTSIDAGASFDMDGSAVVKIGSHAFNVDQVKGFLRVTSSSLYRTGGGFKSTSITGEVSFTHSQSKVLHGNFLESDTVGGKIIWKHLTVDQTEGYMATMQTLTGELRISSVDVTNARHGINIGVVETNARLSYTIGKLSGLDQDLLKVQQLKGTISYTAVDADDIGRFSRIDQSTATGELTYRLGTLKQGKEANMFELFGDARYNLESSRLDSYGGGIRYRPSSNSALGFRMDSVDMGGRGGRDTRFGIFFSFSFDLEDSTGVLETDLLQVTNCGFTGFDSAIILEGGTGFITNSSFTDNYVGIESRVTDVAVTHSLFANQESYAATQWEQCPPLNALSCDWGDVTGPLDASADTSLGDCGNYNPSGLGDEVTDFIDYGDFLDETPRIDLVLELLGNPNPMQNEAVPVRAILTNEGETEQVLSFWLESSRPSGLPTILIPQFVMDCANPLVVDLLPGETESYFCTGVIPPHEPPGFHRITGYVGYYSSQAFAEDSFDLNIQRDPNIVGEDFRRWVQSVHDAGGRTRRIGPVPVVYVQEQWD